MPGAPIAAVSSCWGECRPVACALRKCLAFRENFELSMEVSMSSPRPNRRGLDEGLAREPHSADFLFRPVSELCHMVKLSE